MTSPVQGFYYAVGTYAEWKASYFEPHELVGEDPSDGVLTTTAYGSDSDQDGVPLLLEYAFNLSPVEADQRVLVPGSETGGMPLVRFDDSIAQPRLVIEYLRRREEGSPRLSYYPEFSSALESGWEGATSETVVPINALWERVRAEDVVSSNEDSARFGRVRVELR